MDQAHRRNSFDALRLLGATLVLLGHSFALTGGKSPEILGQGFHIIGVKMFFIISGYLITKSWLRDPRHVPYSLPNTANHCPFSAKYWSRGADYICPLCNSAARCAVMDMCGGTDAWLASANPAQLFHTQARQPRPMNFSSPASNLKIEQFSCARGSFSQITPRSLPALTIFSQGVAQRLMQYAAGREYATHSLSCG